MATETMQATSVAEVAHKLVDLCRQGKNMEAIEQYYAQDVVSVESMSGPTMPSETKGLEDVKAKSAWWVENHEVHSAEVSEPLIGEGNQFALHFKYDVTNKPSGRRMLMDEMGLYTVENAKVVREHFFYKTS
jgi:hypothetical protein